MTHWFARLDVKRKLRLVNTLTLGAALVATAGILLLHLWSSGREDLQRHGLMLGQVMADGLGPTLAFDDATAAAELIGALAGHQDVDSAELRDAAGEIFARYRRADTAGALPGLPEHRLELTLPVRSGDATLGSLHLHLDLAPARQQAVHSLLLLLGLFTGIALVSLNLLGRLQRAIIRPLDALNETMRRIAHDGDYTARVSVATGDEFGALGDGFNQMIAQIEERNRRLGRELSERQRTEELLRRSEMRLHLALENARAGSYEWHADSGIAHWSDELWALFGLTPGCMLPGYESWLTLIHPLDRERAGRQVLEAVSAGEGYQLAWRLAGAADEAPRWIMERGNPMRDSSGRLLRYLGISIDITEQKRVEERLEDYRSHLEERVAERTAQLAAAEAEQRHLNRALRLLSDCNLTLVHARDENALLDEICRLVVESGGYLMGWIGFPEHDAAHSVRRAAVSGYEQGYLDEIELSWDPANPLSQGPTGTALFSGRTQVVNHSTDQPRMRPWLAAAQRRGYRACIALPLRSGQQTLGVLNLYAAEAEAFTSAEIKLLEELAGNIAYGLEALRTRQELDRYRQHLEERVSERTQEIADLNAALAARARDAETANTAKSQFLATMSHEIRTPLNAVLGLTGLLADTPLDRRQRDYADKIELSARALRALIDDILDFSKIEAGALHLEAAPFSLNTLLRTTATIISVGLRDKPVEALFDIAPGLPDAFIGDTLRLQQILLNLTSNAIKFTEAGLILVSVRGEPAGDGRLRLSFSVRDTGIGIPPEQQARIFEVFAQADSSTSRRYGGSGLGLAISARLADLMGGEIRLHSTPGEGSEFCFTLPLPPASAPVAAPTPAGLEHLRVLIVDDHPLARELLLRTATDLGWQADTAGSAEEAMRALQAALARGDDYDLMLLDWQMPGTDGLSLLRRAYATPGMGLPLVVLMAPASAMEEAVAASDDLYLDGMLAKPVIPSALIDAVQRAYAGDLSDLLPRPGRNDRRLAGLRLLVVDDNDLNRQVIEQILSQAGAEVALAADGTQAVAALEIAPHAYDAILMDIQMPVMDGLTATRHLRDALGAALPIIGITAYARPEDYRLSREAGMDGLLIKPVDIDSLLEQLALTEPGRRRPTGTSTVPLITVPGLEPTALQAFNGDRATLGSLLMQFSERHAGDAARLRQRLAERQDEAGARAAHELAGMAAFLRAPWVAERAAELEQRIRAGDRGGALISLNALELALAELIRGIGHFTGQATEASLAGHPAPTESLSEAAPTR